MRKTALFKMTVILLHARKVPASKLANDYPE